jgi:hypothetical protein
MLTYECDEYQYVENIRRLIESTHDKIIVNRKITLHDDGRYRPSVLPAVEFVNYSGILDRKSLKSNVYLIKPFYDDFINGGLMQMKSYIVTTILDFQEYQSPILGWNIQ